MYFRLFGDPREMHSCNSPVLPSISKQNIFAYRLKQTLSAKMQIDDLERQLLTNHQWQLELAARMLGLHRGGQDDAHRVRGCTIQKP